MVSLWDSLGQAGYANLQMYPWKSEQQFMEAQRRAAEDVQRVWTATTYGRPGQVIPVWQPMIFQVEEPTPEEIQSKKEKAIAHKKRCKEYMKFFHKVQQQVRRRMYGNPSNNRRCVAQAVEGSVRVSNKASVGKGSGRGKAL